MPIVRILRIMSFMLFLGLRVMVQGDRAAPWTRKELASLGATFVKLGQLLSLRSDLLSPAWLEEFSHLQDDLDPVPITEIRRTIEEEFGVPLEKKYDWIEERPVAVASIAQVHKAGYKVSGKPVVAAVKVQPPGIESQFMADIFILGRLKFLLYLAPGFLGGHSQDILKELEDSIIAELDFIAEAKNQSAFKRLFADDDSVIVPKIDWGRTRKRVLTAEYVQSIKITRLPTEYKGRCKTASELILKAYVRQILKAGFFHPDPHPGNLGIIIDGAVTRLVFYDFGMFGELPPETKEGLFQLAEAVVMSDLDSVVNLVVQLGLIDRAALHNTEIRDVIERFVIGEIDQNPTELILRVREQLLEVSEKATLRYPRYLSMLGRTVFALEGTLLLIRPEMNLIKESAPYARALYTESLKDRVEFDTTRLLTSARKIWGQIEGPVQVNDKNNIASLRKLRFAVRSLSSSIITGSLLITAGLILEKSLLGFAIVIVVAHVFLFKHLKTDRKVD